MKHLFSLCLLLLIGLPALSSAGDIQVLCEPGLKVYLDGEFMGVSNSKEDGLYLASVDRILDVIVAQDNGFNNLMLFGHNPGFTDFANFLVPGLTHNLPTAGLVCVEIDQDDWNLYERPATKLLVHDWPKKPL